MFDVWFDSVPREQFTREVFRKAPLAQPRSAGPAIPLLTWNTVAELATRLPLPRTLVVRNGRLVDVEPQSFPEVQNLFGAGCSIVFRNVERHIPAMQALARQFESQFDGEVVIQVYVTPGGHHSFGWHYDVEDVFIAQTAGTKEYFLRANTVNPQPRLSTLPRDLQYEQERSPAQACTLIAGDSLYIPAGWWHYARALEDSLSISVGVLGPDAR